MVYVCRSRWRRPTGRYVGGVHFQRLLREPPSTLVSALLDSDLEPLQAATSSTSSPATSPRITWSTPGPRHRPAASVRSPSTTCSTTCCRPTGGAPSSMPCPPSDLGAGPTRGRRSAVARPSAEPDRLNTPGAGSARSCPGPAGTGHLRHLRRGLARFMGTAPLPHLDDGHHHLLGALERAVRSDAAAVRRVPVHLPHVGAVAAGLVRRPAHPARAEPADRDRVAIERDRSRPPRAGRTWTTWPRDHGTAVSVGELAPATSCARSCATSCPRILADLDDEERDRDRTELNGGSEDAGQLSERRRSRRISIWPTGWSRSSSRCGRSTRHRRRAQRLGQPHLPSRRRPDDPPPPLALLRRAGDQGAALDFAAGTAPPGADPPAGRRGLTGSAVADAGRSTPGLDGPGVPRPGSTTSSPSPAPWPRSWSPCGPARHRRSAPGPPQLVAGRPLDHYLDEARAALPSSPTRSRRAGDRDPGHRVASTWSGPPVWFTATSPSATCWSTTIGSRR